VARHVAAQKGPIRPRSVDPAKDNFGRVEIAAKSVKSHNAQYGIIDSAKPIGNAGNSNSMQERAPGALSSIANIKN
jgi:hypothetical protein